MRWVRWCWLCRQREVNGPAADLCARCQVDVEDGLARMEEELNG